MRIIRAAAVLAVVLHIVLPCAAAAQTPVSFEAASIKRNTAAYQGSFVGRQPGGRFTATAATLRELIEFAYLIQPFQLVNAPKWIEEDRWDISARLAAPSAPVAPGLPDDALLALRALLAERFALAVRPETRQLPIYALVLARPDGRLGPQLTKAAIDCNALRAARAKGDTTPLPPAAKSCGTRGRVDSLQMGGSPMSDFALSLSPRLQRTVVDRTGLAGPWDLTLTYTPDPSQISPGTFLPGTQPQFDPNGPSLFAAVQEQLGLKLESTNGPVAVLVVERAERARED
jgi:uncharacterized protein (TIGR03435 family)